MEAETSLSSLEELDTTNLSEAQKAGLEKAKDALAFVYSINSAMIQNGANLPEEPDVTLMESMLDSFVCELSAAVNLLIEVEGVPSRLRSIADELQTAVNTGIVEIDAQYITANRKLAERIERSASVVKNLMENQKNE